MSTTPRLFVLQAGHVIPIILDVIATNRVAKKKQEVVATLLADLGRF